MFLVLIRRRRWFQAPRHLLVPAPHTNPRLFKVGLFLATAEQILGVM